MSGSAAQVTPISGGGHDADGVAQQPWLLDGYAPMGGLVSTPQDMATLLQAMLDGTAPGLAALDPVLQLSDGHFEGLLWDVHVYDGAGHILAAHAGGTPGYSSYVAVDRASGIAVAVLADGKTNVQALGERLMTTPLGP
jgi:CubicO group peptidase (beta-lactamase class C family)